MVAEADRAGRPHGTLAPGRPLEVPVESVRITYLRFRRRGGAQADGMHSSRLALGAHQEISRQLFEYALASDSGDWPRLGELFSHGRFFFADAAGAEAVIRWGETTVKDTAVTQHAISTVSIELDDIQSPGAAEVRNYLSLSALDGAGVAQLVSACWFHSRFERLDGVWRWRTHEVHPIFRGDWTLIHRSQQFPPNTS
jgi:hypothetical protein